MESNKYTMQKDKYTYLNLLTFSILNLWDVKRYTSKAYFEFGNRVRLRDILVPYSKSITKNEIINNKLRIIAKINFGGELFLREYDEVNTYKGNLALVPENSIIFSKINVRHGCIYYHKKGKTPFCVSSEYPTFVFDETKVNGAFLQMLLRTSEFKKLLNSKSTGISKARVKKDEFLDIEIPLPSFFEQEDIVNKYNLKIEQVKHLQKDAGVLERGIDDYLSIKLGVKEHKLQVVLKGLQFSHFTNSEKWGFEFLRKSGSKDKGKYITKELREICTISSGGTPSRNNKEFYNGNIPWIKTGEVINDVIYDTEEKISQDAIDNSSAKVYPKDSLIIAMYGQGATRGRTAKLGIDASTNQACAVLFNIDNRILLTDYVWVFLMNEYERLRAMASGNNQPNLNAGMINGYHIQIPPMEIQQEIVDYFFETRKRIKEIKQQVELNINLAQKDFEKTIFS
jgi:type I restriction enzyme S subunit